MSYQSYIDSFSGDTGTKEIYNRRLLAVIQHSKLEYTEDIPRVHADLIRSKPEILSYYTIGHSLLYRTI